MKKKLIGIVVFMLFIATALTASGDVLLDITSKPKLTGDTLYVGGSGPGNYTKIQDAINDANNWDIVFVYDDSSPYYENIIVDKSITLIGEDKDSTIIDAGGSGGVIYVSEDDVTISGFTIQNSGWDGIFVSQVDYPPWTIEIYNVTIYDNIIKNVSRGIFGITLINGNIYDNNIDNIDTGILLGFSSNNNVYGNFIAHAKYRGIEIQGMRSGHIILDMIRYPPSENNIIHSNTVEYNRWGIDVGSACVGTKVYENNIINNHETGLEVYTSTKTEIKRNNFIQTENNIGYKHADFSVVNRFSQFITNSWDENYWGEPKDAPVPINGKFHFVIFIPIGFKGGLELDIFEFPLVTYDRNPAQEPYDIEV
jgi:hypothetical protein